MEEPEIATDEKCVLHVMPYVAISGSRDSTDFCCCSHGTW